MPVTLDEKLDRAAKILDKRQNKLTQDLALFRDKARKQRTRILINGGQMLEDTGLLDLPREELLAELRTLAKSIEKRRGHSLPNKRSSPASDDTTSEADARPLHVVSQAG